MAGLQEPAHRRYYYPCREMFLLALICPLFGHYNNQYNPKKIIKKKILLFNI